jgi:predicted nucleotidyltransferase
MCIPGLPDETVERLLQVLKQHPRVTAVWLYGSRAMERQRPGSDIDLCLDGAELGHNDRLRLMAAIDDLLLPWSIDLALRSELPDDLAAHVLRVGRCLWQRCV